MNNSGVDTEELKAEKKISGNVIVSVVIPNYNHSAYLGQRIDSVLNQTFSDMEVIILDDCSSDNSLGVIKMYKDHPKVAHVLINEANSGSTFLQWKKGIELARGEWIWIAESDDWCEPNFLETLLKEVDAQTAIAFCQSTVVDAENSILWKTTSDQLINKVQGKTFFRMHWDYNQIINASMAIFRKEKYNKIQQHFLKWKYIGDWVFWLELAMQGSVIISGKNLNYFRKHPRDIQSKALLEGVWHLEKLETIALFSKEGLISDKEADSARKKEFVRYLVNRKWIIPVKRKELYHHFKTSIGLGIYPFYLKNKVLVLLRKII